MTHYSSYSIESIDPSALIDAIFYSLPDGIALFGSDEQSIAYANQAFCEIFGYECEMISESYAAITILPPHIVAEIRERYPFLDEQAADATPRYYSSTRKNGEPLEVRVTETVFTSNNKTHRLLTVVDVTVQRRLEKSRENAERIIRHDLRDYVVSLGNAAEIMAHLRDDENASSEMLDTIRDIVVQTMDLMESGQQAFLMEEGLYKLAPEPVELHDLANQAKYMLDPMAKRYGVTMDMDLPPVEQQITFSGERSLMVRALTNVIRNAIEAEERGSTIAVRCFNGEKAVRIEVRNSTTVDPNVSDRFFEKYVSGSHKGAGLGTYIAKLIVELHSGAISMQSSERDGTTVTITIPRG